MRMRGRNLRKRGRGGGLLPGLLIGAAVFALLTLSSAALIAKGSLAPESGRLLSRLAFSAAALSACWITVRGCGGRRLLWSLLCVGLLALGAMLPAILSGTEKLNPAAVCGMSLLAALLGTALGIRRKESLL